MTYYVFLRAVNVGPATKVDMALLKKHIFDKYRITIETYKNSGNIIVKEPDDREGILNVIKESIKNLSAISVAVLGRDKGQLIHYLDMNPFKESKYEKSKTILYIVEDEVDKGKIAEIAKKNGIIEEYWYNEEVLYVYYQNGIGRSKLTTTLLEKVFDCKVTGRNVNTVEELISKW